ncbi:kelch-like protein 33 [Aplochiton taeniatus]
MAVAPSTCEADWGSLWRVMLRKRRQRESGCLANEWLDLDYEGEEEEGGEEEEPGHDDDSDYKSQEEGTVEDGQSEERGSEDTIKVYDGPTYVVKIFQALENFRDSSLLTDLSLSTEDGQSVDVHSPVLAAVSSFIHREMQARDKTIQSSTMEGIHVEMKNKMSLVLGPGVDRVGLQGVVEFAYTGAVASLNTDTLVQIQAAAHPLGVPRVLDLCTEEEERRKREGEGKKESKVSAAEQMRMSLQSIRVLWEERLGCDVILEVEGMSFDVHRVVMAASSDYFRGMFTSGMRESQQPRVTLPFLVASELEALIGCSYSGALPLSWGGVFEITCTALQLQFPHALSMGLDFLSQEMDTSSCLDVASFAQAYGMASLLQRADDFVVRHFEKVAATGKFQDLPGEQLHRYLESNLLCVSSELAVYKAVVAWIEGDRAERMAFAKELMSRIQFSLMTFKDFKEVQILKMWTESECQSLYHSILEDFCSNRNAPRTEFRAYLPRASVVLVGGDQILQDLSKRIPSREMWFANSIRNHVGCVKELEWRRLGEMPDFPRFSHEVVALGGQLYVAGGQKYYGVHDTLDTAYRNVHLLDQALSCHAAVILNGAIFVSGGLDCRNQGLVSLFLYHPDRGTTYLAEMASPRSYHCMEAVDGHLYVAGGITTKKSLGIIDQLACEVYDPVTDSWSSFPPLPIPHVGAASVALEGKFYVLGGYRLDCGEIRKVHRYDPFSGRWEHMGKMPDGPNNDVRACVLQLPQHLRQ